ncbi:MAG: response regulator [Desulfobacteraceae bacterium]|jgi:DNA-binding NtrC family response regulator
MNIMLVDDEQKFAMMLAKRLELRGIGATVFFTGDEALKAVEDGRRFDVALLDVKMPGIGGIDLRRKLNALDDRMKFVFLTGHGSDTDYQVGAREAYDYLAKPLKIENLIEVLNRLDEAP